jgi:hypothetical protein
MKNVCVYSLDLGDIEGKGDFLCPRCGNTISPDDESEEAYSIIEPKVNSQGLTELIIRCNKCASIIHLTGFSVIEEIESKNREENKGDKTEVNISYITHI